MKVRNRLFGFFWLVPILLLVFVAITCASDFVVVVNKGVSYNSLNKGDIRAIFLGDKTRWDDGKSVKIAVLEGGSASKSFLKTIVGKTPSQFEIYWKNLIFSGQAAAPKTFDDAASLVQFVSSSSGAIGFVSEDQVSGSVKTISIK